MTPADTLKNLTPAFEAAVLPKRYGGLSGVDPLKEGGVVPPELYKSAQVDAYSHVSVPAGKKQIVPVPVSKDAVPCLLSWEFFTSSASGQVAFELTFQTDEDAQASSLIENQRYESHVSSQSGNFKCDKEGIYCLVFDNSFSWRTTK